VIGGQRYAFIRPDAAAMGPRFKFRKYGQSGMEMSEILPHIGSIADEICLIRSVHTEQFNHAPGQLFMNTGFSQPGRPSMGSWVLYGLGSETRDLPAYVVFPSGVLSGGSALWSSGFLPTVYSGVRLRSDKEPISNVSSPAGFDATLEQDTLETVSRLNRRRLEAVGDPEIATRIAAYEMAHRLQTSAPELFDLSGESKATLEMYGIEDPSKPTFARSCLLSRRMIERGVRFVMLFNEVWDAHSDLEGNHRKNCRETDQASAALVKDLSQRGMLEETLVVWGGEFGRTPMIESNPALGRSKGRDHHPQAFSMWMAGGGIKGGMTYGATDELGFHVAENPVHIHDVQATILHQLGLDHERLTFTHQGRPFRLTDVHGKLVEAILA
jgi:hypothetical protein